MMNNRSAQTFYLYRITNVITDENHGGFWSKNEAAALDLLAHRVGYQTYNEALVDNGMSGALEAKKDLNEEPMVIKPCAST